MALLAAVAQDRFGEEIVDHLRREGVDTSLLKWVGETRTPFTAVIELELGESLAVNWQNTQHVRLDPADLEAVAPYLNSYDAVLVTFELPQETFERVLTLTGNLTDPRPTTIVTPGQPYESPISGRSLSKIDYMVAHEWELGQYASANPEAFEPAEAAQRLLAYGVGTVCIPKNEDCYFFSAQAGVIKVVPTFKPHYKESAIARDAFCAGLAAKLIEEGKAFSDEVALWAAAARTAATADHPLEDPLPDRQRVQWTTRAVTIEREASQ